MKPCPSDFSLDDLEIHGGGASPELAAHVAGCDRCRTRGAARVARQEEFRAEMSPAVWRAIEGRIPSRPWWRRRWVMPALTATVVAAVLLVAHLDPDAGNRGSYVGTKGAPSVEIICRRGAETASLAPGAAVAPGDELRFRPLASPPDARYLMIGSVDGSGRFAPFYPARADGESVALPPAGAPLPGGIRIDATPGPERLVVLWSAAPVSAAAVAPVAEAAAERLAPILEIAGVAVTSAWQLLPKDALAGQEGKDK
jgi:hypothetical protein